MSQNNFNVTVQIRRTTTEVCTVLLPVEASDFGSAQTQAEAVVNKASYLLDVPFVEAGWSDVIETKSVVFCGPSEPSASASLPESATDFAPAYLAGVDRTDGSTYQPVAREQILLD